MPPSLSGLVIRRAYGLTLREVQANFPASARIARRPGRGFRVSSRIHRLRRTAFETGRADLGLWPDLCGTSRGRWQHLCQRQISLLSWTFVSFKNLIGPKFGPLFTRWSLLQTPLLTTRR